MLQKRVFYAEKWLRSFLSEKMIRSVEVYEAGELEGHSKRTIRRAIENIGVEVKKDRAAHGCWFLRLPK